MGFLRALRVVVSFPKWSNPSVLFDAVCRLSYIGYCTVPSRLCFSVLFMGIYSIVIALLKVRFQDVSHETNGKLPYRIPLMWSGIQNRVLRHSL